MWNSKGGLNTGIVVVYTCVRSVCVASTILYVYTYMYMCIHIKVCLCVNVFTWVHGT